MRCVPRIAIVFLLTTLLGSCGDDAVVSDAGTPDASDGGQISEAGLDGDSSATPTVCQLEQEALLKFVKAHKSCATDADCTYVPAESLWHEHCLSTGSTEAGYAGGFYLNATHDAGAMGALVTALETCLPPLQPCNLSPFPPTCWHGQCAAKLDIDAKNQCVADLGGESACTKCACGFCDSCGGVLERPVVLCAMKAGCFGTPECDPSSSTFPCADALAETGGGSFAQCNACIGGWLCALDCAGS